MKALLVATAAVGFLCAAVANADTATKTPQQIVDQREAGMKSMVASLKGASDAATPAEAKAKLAKAIAFAESIPTLFPKGTGIGDPGVTKSRAVQDIWTKWDDFKKASDNLVAALKETDAAIGSGDKAKVAAGFDAVRKSCGGCHTPFRGPEN